MPIHYYLLLICLLYSCTKSERQDIIFDDFEDGKFVKWAKQGEAFLEATNVDSLQINIVNANGKFVAYSRFSGSGESHDQGKLVSEKFIINRNFISFLIAGQEHSNRSCINLIIENKIERSATGKNDLQLRPEVWDVKEFEGKEAYLEIVDAMANTSDNPSVARVIVDHIVFSDNKYDREAIFEDFESGTYNNWTVEGDAFSIPRNRTNVYYPISADGFKGNYFAFSFGENHDKKTGKLTSKTFIINHDFIKFLIGGGNHNAETCINLVINNQVVHTSEGQNDGKMRAEIWDVGKYKGQKAYFEIIDNHSGSWGHIMVDHIVFYNQAPYKKYLSWLLIFIVLILSGFFFVKHKGKSPTPSNLINEEEIKELESIKNKIKEEKNYIKQDYNIERLANETGKDETEINALFENIDSSSFSNYINHLRVEEFKQRIQDPANNAYTMLSIAQDCGFSSKTSFYRIFKAHTNMTPSEYRNEIS